MDELLHGEEKAVFGDKGYFSDPILVLLFRGSLNIPPDLEAAAHNIIIGRAVQVDVGEVNGRIFLNNSSLGLYPSIVLHRDKQQEQLGRGKWPAFSLATLTMLRRYPFMGVRLSISDRELVRRTPFVYWQQ